PVISVKNPAMGFPRLPSMAVDGPKFGRPSLAASFRSKMFSLEPVSKTTGTGSLPATLRVVSTQSLDCHMWRPPNGCWPRPRLAFSAVRRMSSADTLSQNRPLDVQFLIVTRLCRNLLASLRVSSTHLCRSHSDNFSRTCVKSCPCLPALDRLSDQLLAPLGEASTFRWQIGTLLQGRRR